MIRSLAPSSGVYKLSVFNWIIFCSASDKHSNLILSFPYISKTVWTKANQNKSSLKSACYSCLVPQKTIVNVNILKVKQKKEKGMVK
jgi:hypothetical protein